MKSTNKGKATNKGTNKGKSVKAQTIAPMVEKSTNEKKSAGKENTMENEVKGLVPMATMEETSANMSVRVIQGKKKNKLAESLEKYLREQVSALDAIGKLASIQIAYKDFVSAFANYNGDTVSATSLDLHKDIYTVCHKLAKERKASGAERIPVLMTQGGATVGTFCTVKTSRYDEFYSMADKAEQSRAERKSKGNGKSKATAETTEQSNGAEQSADYTAIDTAEKATTAILLLIEKYGANLNTSAIYTALDACLPSANDTTASA